MKGMLHISAPLLHLLHWPHKKSSHSLCFHTWLSSPPGCQTAEQNTPKNIHFSPSISWRTLARKPAIFEVTGFADYKKKKKVPELWSWLSSCSTVLFHPGAVIARASKGMKGTRKERRKRQHLVIPYLIACDICHGLTEHVKTPCRHCTGEVGLSRGDTNESKPHTQTLDWKKALMFFQHRKYLDLGFFNSVAPDVLKIHVCKCQTPSCVQGESWRSHQQISAHCSAEVTISMARQWLSLQQCQGIPAGEAIRKSPRKLCNLHNF